MIEFNSPYRDLLTQFYTFCRIILSEEIINNEVDRYEDRHNHSKHRVHRQITASIALALEGV